MQPSLNSSLFAGYPFYGQRPTLHFVGVGGSGMSSLAEVFVRLGFRVQGSDLRLSQRTADLQARGVQVYEGHRADHVNGADAVVVSSAVPNDNAEVVAARQRHVPLLQRGSLLAQLMRFQHGIAVAGTHGKSTTTGLVGCVLQYTGLDPTVLVGGRVNHLGSHARVGKGSFLVAEADESDGSFLQLRPSIAVLTNIDREHLDYWQGDVSYLQEACVQFADALPFYGTLVACCDCPLVRDVLRRTKSRWISYGLQPQAHYAATQIEQDGDGLHTSFVVCKQQQPLGRVRLRLAGQHNVQNALAAIAVGDLLQVPFERASQALTEFAGIGRRFHVVGQAGGVTVVDDYAHHPTAIRAVLQTAAQVFAGKRLVVLFQPHRYSRTQALLPEFAGCFALADRLLLTDIYAASESQATVHARDLLQAVQQQGHAHARYVGDIAAAVPQLLQLLQPGDVVLTLGAGSIASCAQQLLLQLQSRA
ncbi:MAG: UDP-N-acetylmuramate--L-alanine ligase [Myxococcota bacterium]